MKNIVTKRAYYKDISYFSHIYFLDINYDFNEKSIEELVDFVNSDPFSDVLIHTNDITLDVIHTIKELSKVKTIWLQSDTFLFEDFGVMDKEVLQILGIDKIQIMIDALGDIIDFNKSVENEKLVKFNYMELPF